MGCNNGSEVFLWSHNCFLAPQSKISNWTKGNPQPDNTQFPVSRYYFVTILSMFIHSWASHRFIKAVNFYLLIRGDVRRKTLSLDLSSASKIFTWQNILADQGFCGWAEGGWKGVALFMTKLLGNSSSGNLSSGNAAMKWRKSAPQSQGHLVTMGVTIQKNIFAHVILNQK